MFCQIGQGQTQSEGVSDGLAVVEEQQTPTHKTARIDQQVGKTHPIAVGEGRRCGHTGGIAAAELHDEIDLSVGGHDLLETFRTRGHRQVPVQIESDGTRAGRGQLQDHFGQSVVGQRPAPQSADVVVIDKHHGHPVLVPVGIGPAVDIQIVGCQFHGLQTTQKTKPGDRQKCHQTNAESDTDRLAQPVNQGMDRGGVA